MASFISLPLVWQAALAGVLTAALTAAVSLARNVRRARLTGLPYVISPAHELEAWTFLTDPVLRSLYGTHVMQGIRWPRWARFMIRDWHFADKGRAHEEFGPVFIVVSPGGLLCYVADAEAATLITAQRKVFVKPRSKMSMCRKNSHLQWKRRLTKAQES